MLFMQISQEHSKATILAPRAVVSSMFPATHQVEKILLLAELHRDGFPEKAEVSLGDNTNLARASMGEWSTYTPGRYNLVCTVKVWYRNGDFMECVTGCHDELKGGVDQ